MSHKTTRQQILEVLQSKGQASAAEIGSLLHLTSANVRHHLGNLEREGLVQPGGNAPGSGRGRPALLYRLRAPAQAHNLDYLSSILLRLRAHSSTEEDLAARLAAGLLDEFAPLELARSPAMRVASAVQRLNKFHYQARWEAHTSGARIILGHCPYAAIVQNHPELCRMDAELLEGLLGAAVEHTARLEPAPSGLPQCVFTIRAGR
jgi:predicted ArsR family transcriptional regulator